jgi:membrane protein implicated in regulation of membrane protease activity
MHTDPKKRHQQDMVKQIWLPLGAVIVLICVVLVLTILATTTNSAAVDKGASTALIYMIILWSIGGLVELALLVLAIVLAGKMYNGLPSKTGAVYNAVEQVKKGVGTVTEKISKPVININGYTAGVKAFIKGLRVR